MNDNNEPRRPPCLDDALGQGDLSSLSSLSVSNWTKVGSTETQSRREEVITVGDVCEAFATEETLRDVGGSQNEEKKEEEETKTQTQEEKQEENEHDDTNNNNKNKKLSLVDALDREERRLNDGGGGGGGDQNLKKPTPVVEWSLANETLRSDATNRRETPAKKEETRSYLVALNRRRRGDDTAGERSKRFERKKTARHQPSAGSLPTRDVDRRVLAAERGLSEDATDEELFEVVDRLAKLVYAEEDEELQENGDNANANAIANANANTLPVVREDVEIVNEPDRRFEMLKDVVVTGYLVPSFNNTKFDWDEPVSRSVHRCVTRRRLFALVGCVIALLMTLAVAFLLTREDDDGDLSSTLATGSPTPTTTSFSTSTSTFTSSTSSTSLGAWRPLGAPLMYGCAVALSPNGDRLWGGDLGVLHVHDLILSSNAADSAASWKRTTDLSSYFKKVPSVAVSADGHVFVVGDPYHDDNAGAAFVFVRSDDVDGATTEWVQRGPTLTVENRTSGGFGQSVDVSGDGGVVVVGSFSNPVYAIYVHDALRNAYALQHRERVGDEDGTSVSLSSDASRLVVGVPGSNLAYVYNASSFSLPKRLQILEGYRQTAKDHFGDAVAISADGATVAVGARKGDYVRAYRANKDDDAYRSCDGRTLVGTEGSRFGFSVALSARGSRLVVGATHADAGGWGRAGEAVVFDLDPNNSKVSRVGELRGTAINERMGWSVAISDDGTRVALGGPSYPHLENPDVGGIRVYYEESFVDSNSSSLSLSSLSSSSNGGA